MNVFGTMIRAALIEDGEHPYDAEDFAEDIQDNLTDDETAWIVNAGTELDEDTEMGFVHIGYRNDEPSVLNYRDWFYDGENGSGLSDDF